MTIIIVCMEEQGVSILIMKLCFVFVIITAILWIKRPLFWAISDGLTVALALYGIRVLDTLSAMGRSMASKDTAIVVLGFCLITFLQYVLERRNRSKQTEQPLNWLLNNRRVSASVAPTVINLFSSAGAMTICVEIVRSSCQDYLSNEDMACVTSSCHHILENFLPTYLFILIALAVFDVRAEEFVLAMLPLVAALFLIRRMFYLRKVFRSTGQKTEENEKKITVVLLKSLWPIILIVVLIIALGIPVYVTAPMVVVLNILVNHPKPWEIKPILRTAFEPIIIFNTTLVMMFKDIITYTGAVHELLVFFGDLPIPLPVVFVLILLFSTITNGSNVIMPLCMPMAMVTMPGAGVPLLVLLISFAYVAMQISPTHICLFTVAECFKVDIGTLIKRSIPMILMFSVVTLACIALLGVFQAR